MFYVNEGNQKKQYTLDTTYGNMRKALEMIIKRNLTMTNKVVIASTTAIKEGKCVYLQSRAYAFGLEEYFSRIYGEGKGKRAVG